MDWQSSLRQYMAKAALLPYRSESDAKSRSTLASESQTLKRAAEHIERCFAYVKLTVAGVSTAAAEETVPIT